MDIKDIISSQEISAKMKQGWLNTPFLMRPDPEAAKASWQAYLDKQAAIKARYAPELWAAAEAAYALIDFGYDGGGESSEATIATIADAMKSWRSNPTV